MIYELTDLISRIKARRTTDAQAREELLRIALISEEQLAARGLSVEYADYGLWRLLKGGDILFEGSEFECSQKAFSIKPNNS